MKYRSNIIIMLLLCVMLFLIVSHEPYVQANSNKKFAQDQYMTIKEKVFSNNTSFDAAYMKSITMDITFALKDYYDTKEYYGYDVRLTDFACKLYNIENCIDDKTVREDLHTAAGLILYGAENQSADALVYAYEIIETLNAFLFNYPIQQENFNDWLIEANKDEITKMYNVSKTFGGNYNEEIENFLKKAPYVNMKTDHMSDSLKIRNEYLRANYAAIKSKWNNAQTLNLMKSVSQEMSYLHEKSTKWRIPGNVDAEISLEEKSNINEIKLNVKKLIDILPEIDGYNISLKDDYNRIYNYMADFNSEIWTSDIDLDILELSRLADELYYFFCSENSKEWIYNNHMVYFISDTLEIEETGYDGRIVFDEVDKSKKCKYKYNFKFSDANNYIDFYLKPVINGLDNIKLFSIDGIDNLTNEADITIINEIEHLNAMDMLKISCPLNSKNNETIDSLKYGFCFEDKYGTIQAYGLQISGFGEICLKNIIISS